MNFVGFFSSLVLALMFGSQVFAQTTHVMSCTTQTEGMETPTITVDLIVQTESTADFVMLNLVDQGQTTTLFTQLEKGELMQSLASGGLTQVFLKEDFKIEDGAIRNSGIFAIAVTGKKAEGLLAALGNLYPLACDLH